jgi:poly(A) polymerase
MGVARFRDWVLLRWAAGAKGGGAIQWRMLLSVADSWRRPKFPLTGLDVMKAGVPEGPAVGRVLHELEEWWMDKDFPDDALALSEQLKAIVQAGEF